MSIAQNFPTIVPSLNLSFALTKTLDSRITFTRATTATYYGTRTALAEQNLFQYSQEFDDAYWSKIRLSVTANTTAAPDGTTTADSLIENTDTNTRVLRRSVTTAAGTHVFSVFAKANTRSWIYLSGSIVGSTWFDLSTGAVGTVGAGVTASIQNLGNGWYRCIVAVTATAALNAFDVGLSTGDNVSSYTGDGTSGVFLWGAQLEKRSSVTAYTHTNTQTVTNYIPVLETAASGVARFDHNPVTFESLGLLIEQQSTNLVLQSQTFDSATWVKNGGGAAVTVIPNTIIAPDGTLTGDKLDEAGGVTQSQVILQGITVANSTAHIFSFYAKAAERSFVYTQAQGANNFQVVFNLTTGTVGVSSGTFTAATITPVGNNWYRCAVTATSTTTSVNWYIEPQATNALGTHLGVANNGIFLWGAQLEATAFSTSYIATVASQVTRAADSASMTGTNFSSWYRADEGTLYTEAQSNGLLSAGPIAVEASNGTINERLVTGQFVAGAVRSLSVQNGNVSQVLLSNTVSPLGYIKSSGAYKFNDFAGTVNGGTVLTDTNGTLPIVDRLTIGSNGSTTTQILNGTIKKIAYYPLRLTNTNLQALTS